jgi:hypothetical protein
MDRSRAVFWLALGLLASILLVALFPRVFVLASSEWQVSRAEAVATARERVRELAALSQEEPPSNPYIVVRHITDAYLEGRILRTPDLDLDAMPRTDLAKRLRGWQVRFYEPGAPQQELAYEVTLSLDGTLLSVRRGVPFDYENPARISLRDARLRAARFLTEHSLSLDDFDAPVERTVDRSKRTDLFLRYRSREAAAGDALQYGVDVAFAGDRLTGYTSYEEDPNVREIEDVLRPASVLQAYWIFVIFLIIPPLAVLFVRRYHQGVVAVNRGVQVFAVIYACSLLALLMTARATTEGNSFGNLTRVQNTWVWIFVQGVVYFPGLAVFGLMSFSLGESYADGKWRDKLASFDAVFQRKLRNATVAASALRGMVAGLVMVVVVLLFALLLSLAGADALIALMLGPWWENARFPGLALPLIQLLYILPYGLFGTIFLMPMLERRFGATRAFALATVITTMLQFAPLVLLPIQAGFPIWLLATGIQIWLFLKFDLLTSLMAPWVMAVTIQAMPMVHAVDRSTQVQGWLALFLVGLPLWLSARWLGSDEQFDYSFDSIPPHVKRIAERERQRVELETARRIQSSILPDLPAQVQGIEVAHTYLPASEVGGDFYDVLALEDGRLSVAIGDVAGHGVSSGLVMSMARSALAVQVTYRPEVIEVFEMLNRVIYQSARKRLLTTLCYLLLDPKTRNLKYASAGHLYPYRMSVDGDVRALESVAYPLGVREHLQIQPREVDLEPGDSVFLSSDGLVEARRIGSDEVFGFDRLEESLVRHAHRGAKGILAGVLDDYDRFVGGGAPPDPELYQRDDDLTALVLTLPR